MEKATKKDWGGVLRGILTAVTLQELLHLLSLYVVGVAVMYLLLVVACLIPNGWIDGNVRQGLQTNRAEDVGRWKEFFAYGQSDKLDLGTDFLILNTLYTDPGQSLFQQAVEGGGETRYWQGYKVWLRPASVLFTYTDLRTLMMYILAALVLLCLVRCQTRFGAGTAAAFGAALTLGHILVVPWLFQYFEVFWIALAAVAWLLRHYRAEQGAAGKLACLFLVIGMATQYFDFLTAPVLTLCLPLAIILLADMRSDALTVAGRWAHFFWPCAAWAFGWLFGWAAKWPLSTWLLGRDVTGDALQRAVYRSAAGTAERRPGILRSLARNIFCFLPMNQLHAHGGDVLLAALAAAYAALILWLLYKLYRRRPDRARVLAALPALACAAVPYLWFVVLAGHTDEHYIFTYRSQIAAAFILIDVWLCLYRGKGGASRG